MKTSALLIAASLAVLSVSAFAQSDMSASRASVKAQIHTTGPAARGDAPNYPTLPEQRSQFSTQRH